MRLVINNIEIDLPKNGGAINRQANSIEKPESFQSTFSREINIPLTSKVRQALGAFNVGSNDKPQYEQVRASLYGINGEQLIANGFLFIQGQQGNTLRANVVDGIVGFFEQIGDRKLSSLNLSAFKHAWDLATVTANLDNDYEDGFVYALADYGQLPSNGNNFLAEELLPSVYAKTLFIEIAKLTSYTFKESEAFTDPFFESLILPFTGQVNDFLKQFTFSIRAVVFNFPTPPSDGIYTINNQNGNQIVIDSDNPANASFDPTTGEFTFPANTVQDVTVRHNFGIDIIPNGNVTAWNYSAQLYSNIKGVLDSDDRTVTSGFNGIDSFLEYTGTFEAGERISTRFVVSGYSGTATTLEYVTLGFPFQITAPAVDFGQALSLESILPDMTIKQFCKSIWLAIGIVPQVNALANEITLRFFEDYATDTANAADWSDKVDYSKAVEREYRYGNYAKANTLKWSEDESLVSPTFADGSIAIQHFQLNAEANIIKLDFAPSDSTFFNNNTLVLCRIAVLNSSYEIEEKVKPRLCYASQATGLGYTVSEGASDNGFNDAKVVRFVDLAEANNLAFEINLIERYFNQFSKMIGGMEKLTLSVNLSPKDFEELDLFRLVYLNINAPNLVANGYYLLQKVKDYSGQGVTLCEFINVNIE